MKRTISLILIMVMLLSILSGCRKTNETESNLSTVSDINIEQLENSSETDTTETEVSSDLVEENSTLSSQNSTSTTTSTNSKPSKKPSSSSNSTVSSVTQPSTDTPTTPVVDTPDVPVDNYVYRDPTVFVDGMDTLETVLNKPRGTKIFMGDVYVDRNYVSEALSYNNITIGKIITFDASHIITDVNKMPSNYKIYPFVVDTIPNWLYEKNISLEQCTNSPIDMYVIGSKSYGRYCESICAFYDIIGKVDYNTIQPGYMYILLKSTVCNSYGDPIDMDKLNEYVDYIKSNQIKSTTIAEPLLPIVYDVSGYGPSVRTKVTVNVESSNTDNIKLFLHDNLTLKKGENVFYIDIPFMYSFMGSDGSAKINVYSKDISQYIIA